MPLPDDYLDTIRSDVADVNNAAGNPGTVTAALYLREFTGASADRWAHLDMSGPAWSDKADGELARGGTGWGVRTLVRWLEGVAAA
jgi:leucyl aminopeptidase